MACVLLKLMNLMGKSSRMKLTSYVVSVNLVIFSLIRVKFCDIVSNYSVVPVLDCCDYCYNHCSAKY